MEKFKNLLTINKKDMECPEDSIEHTDPTRWNMCKYIRDWEFVHFGFRHPFIKYITKVETGYAVAVLLKLDRTPDYIHVQGGSELTRPCFVFSYRLNYGKDPEAFRFDVPPMSFFSSPLPSLNDPEKTAILINNICSI